MIRTKATHLKKVEEGDDTAILELINSKMSSSGVSLTEDLIQQVMAGFREKMASGEVGVSAAARSGMVAEMIAKIKGL